MNYQKTALSLTLIITLGACATTVPNNVKIAHKEDMTHCEFLEDVRGGSTYGAYDARSKALDYAQDIGATHMVWDGETESADHITLKGDAYKCPVK